MAKSREIEEGVVIDFDENDRLIGIDIRDVRQHYSLADIANVNIENIPLGASAQ